MSLKETYTHFRKWAKTETLDKAKTEVNKIVNFSRTNLLEDMVDESAASKNTINELLTTITVEKTIV